MFLAHLPLAKYAEQAKNTEAERKATEIRLRAERRAGEILEDMKETGQRRGSGGDYITSSPQATMLSDLGISRDQAPKWQQLAAIPNHQFESSLRDPVTTPSTSGD